MEGETEKAEGGGRKADDVLEPTTAVPEDALATNVSPANDSASSPLAPPPSALRSPPSDLILFPRRTLYVEAVLYLVIAIGAFAAGYFVGRGGSSTSGADQQAAQRVPVEGKMVYTTSTGRTTGDEGAVIILLPVGKLPSARLSSRGLGPSDKAPSADEESLRQLRDFGGAYGRADAAGNFIVFVPIRGQYRVLAVSHHATRPDEAPLRRADVAEIEEYFDRASRLILNSKYQWTTEQIELGKATLEIEFGREGK